MTKMDNPAYTNNEPNVVQRPSKASVLDATFDSTTSNDKGGTKEENVNLERNVGLFGSIALIVGTMIGSGIFVSPGGVLKEMTSVYVSLIIWVCCGILSMLGGITYIELMTLIPESGGEYTYIVEIFGAIPGFLTSWVSLIMLRPALVAGIALAFAEYTIDPFVDCIDDVKWAKNLMACVCLLFLAFINSFSVRLSGRIQIFFTVAKLGAIAVIIVSGIYKIAQGETDNLKPDFDIAQSNFGNIARAFYSGLWAYDGWNQLNIVSEEIQDPFKNLPRGILFGIPLVIVCYLLVNISFLTVISPLEIMEVPSVANLYGERVLGVMKWLMPLSVAMSSFGAANGTLFTSARVIYAAGRNGHLPDSVAFVGVERKTPVTSIIINTIIAILIIVSLDFDGVVDFFSFGAWIFYGLTAAGVLVLRYTKPDVPRPFRVPLVIPIIVVVMAAFLVIAPVAVAEDWDSRLGYFVALGIMAFGFVLYVPFVHFRWVFPGTHTVGIFLQKLFYAMPPEGKED